MISDLNANKFILNVFQIVIYVYQRVIYYINIFLQNCFKEKNLCTVKLLQNLFVSIVLYKTMLININL